MAGFVTNIEQKTLKNKYFRQVLFTAKNMQLVVMALKPSEDIGMEVHPKVDQFFRIEEGVGKVIQNGVSKKFKAGDVIIVQQGTSHNIINTSKTDWLKLYTIYTPPNHRDGVIHKTKKDAEKAEMDHTDIPPK
jgi:mannose-6-phosphate isomerase-like protein (cupin superfamily)